MCPQESRIFTIEVERTTREVLDLLTRKREYALLTSGLELADARRRNLWQGGYDWVEILGAGENAERPQRERHYLLIGGDLDSRDDMLAPIMQESSQLSSDTRDCSVVFLSVGTLYDFCEGTPLRFQVDASSEAEANEVWLRGMLRLGEDPGKWYASDDFSSIKVLLRHVSGGDEPETGDERTVSGASEPIDIAEFEVYDSLRDKLERSARDPECGYGDDVFVEYSIGSDEGVVRYCATEFYSNHNWCDDPANLLVVRFCGEIVPGECSQEDIRFSHPTKATVRKADDERFLVDSLAMVNDVAVKFYSSRRGEEKRPNEAVSADRVMDNPIDFNMWVDMHRKEIELL